MVVLFVVFCIWLWFFSGTKCRKCGSKNTSYDAGGDVYCYSVDESFICYNCGNDEY